jgi:fructokinase
MAALGVHVRRADGGWPSVVCIGEALIDLFAVDRNVSMEAATEFRAAAGGAPANVAIGVSRLGLSAALIGKVGADPFGRKLRRLLVGEGVDVRGLRDHPTARTPLAFVHPEAAGDQRFVFYRHATADTLLTPDDIDLDLIAHARVLHFCSISLSTEPSRTATLMAARWARDHGLLVSFDPNVRLDLFASRNAARAAIDEALPLAHVLKLSRDEIELLSGCDDPIRAAYNLRQHGPALVVVTLGAGGCAFVDAAGEGFVGAPEVSARDTTGAGDAFMAGLLAALVRSGLDAPDSLADISPVPVLRFASAVGALATTEIGAIPALPHVARVDELLRADTPAHHRNVCAKGEGIHVG